MGLGCVTVRVTVGVLMGNALVIRVRFNVIIRSHAGLIIRH